MISSPCGRVVASPSALRAELALGVDLTLESAQREIDQVRSILRQAIDGLVAEFGERAMREAVVALQFQDISDQLLASASRRIRKTRSALGHESGALHDSPEAPIRASGQPAEFF